MIQSGVDIELGQVGEALWKSDQKSQRTDSFFKKRVYLQSTDPQKSIEKLC